MLKGAPGFVGQGDDRADLGLLLLQDHVFHDRAHVIRDVFDFEGKQIRGPEHGIDGGVKQGEVTRAVFLLQGVADGLDFAGGKRAALPHRFPLVPGPFFHVCFWHRFP